MSLTADTREVQQHPELVEGIGIPITVEPLDAADYAFLDWRCNPIGVERCEVSNLLGKLRSGELESQLRRCEEQYVEIYLLTEGVYDSHKGCLAKYVRQGESYKRLKRKDRKPIMGNTPYEYIVGCLIGIEQMGIKLLHTPNFDCTMRTLRILYSQRRREEHHLFQHVKPIRIPVKMSSNPAVPKLLSLCSHLPEKVAIRLIYRYESIWNILNAPESELLEINGMGRTLLDSLYKGVGKSA